MGSTDLALSWKDHHGVLFTVFEKLLAKKALVDCTLAAEGKFLKAHRIVLSASSPYFEALLDQEYDKHPIIFLRDVKFEDLKTLLEFVYSGEIKIPETRLVEFLNVAEALQIKGLGGPGSESPVKQTPSKSVSRKESDSPLPRKRSRRHSSSSEGNSCDRAEIIPINSENVQPIQRNETEVPELSASSASVNTSNSVTEELSVDISKVKKEVINPQSSLSETQLDDDQGDSSEEILGLKPEFEQVTFTEDYSDDMLPEDDDSELNQDQPSSSHQYSGYTSDTVNPGEMTMHAPYAVGSAEPSVPEGSIIASPRPFPSPSWVTEPSKPAPRSGSDVAEDREWASARETPHPDRTKSQRCSQSKRFDSSFLYESCREEDISQMRFAAERGADTSFLEDLHILKSRRTFECVVCKRFFFSKEGLRRHVLLHEDVKPHACSYCPLTFKHISNLKKHTLIHTGERPYQCEFCPQKFTQINSLQYHTSAKHTNDRPFKCEQCGHSFIRSAALRRHLEVHVRRSLKGFNNCTKPETK